MKFRLQYWSAIAAIATMLGTLEARAADHNWSGLGTGRNWSAAANWDIPLDNDGTDDLIFGAASKLNPRANSGWDINSITFSALGNGNLSGFTISGLTTDEILLEAGAGLGLLNNSTLLQTINTKITLGTSQSFNAAAGSFQLGSVELGSFDLTMTQGSAAQFITVGNLVSGAGSLVKNGAGSVTLLGANTFAGGVTMNAGSLNLGNDLSAGSGNLRLNGGTVMTTATRTIANNVVLGGGSFGGGNNLTLNGVVSGSGTLNKSGAGTVALGNANTATNSVSISGGRLSLDANGALGSVASVGLSGDGHLVLNASGGNLVNNAAPITLLGGTLDANNRTEFFGALGLNGGANTVNLLNDGINGTLLFAGGSFAGGTINIIGWVGQSNVEPTPGGTGDRIFFITPLSGSFLGAISFDGVPTGAFQMPSGEIVPVPEPGSLALLALGGAALMTRVHRRRTD